MRRWLVWMIGLIMIAVASGLYYIYPQLKVLNGYAARTACSCHFIQQRGLASIEAEDLSTGLLRYASVAIDEESGEVYSSVLGLAGKTASYRKGLGCILLKGKDDYNIKFTPSADLVKSSYVFTSGLTAGTDQKFLDSIVRYAFDEEMEVKSKKTRALLVLHKDTLILEAYAKGINAQTPLLGWSMTKSVINALTGIMVKNKKLDLDQKNLFAQWEDGRKEITLRELLNMRSGLEWEENYAKSSTATRMLFDAEDMPAESARAKPGKKNWYYSSGTTNLISGLLRSKFTHLKEYHSFPFDSLFHKLDMEHCVMETDEAGNYIGSSYLYATGRDWLRFGRLYLNDGIWDGERILPAGWVDFTRQSATGSEGKYGAHFWLNQGGISYPDAPHDLFAADGYQGQLVFIIPSKDLVVVRLGLSDIDFNGLLKMICDNVQ
ncbi:MAG: serine hydrolase [Saprospiraceae bacterium]|nr:serine hydrolase [Saprospiraceae bacterium]